MTPGLFKEIVCDGAVNGTPLPSNLRVVAACNPYRLRRRIGGGDEDSGVKTGTVGLTRGIMDAMRVSIALVWVFWTLELGNACGLVNCDCPRCQVLLKSVSGLRLWTQVHDMLHTVERVLSVKCIPYNAVSPFPKSRYCGDRSSSWCVSANVFKVRK